MADLSKKLVLITGASRGLGRAMAESFAKLGHTVVGCGRSEEALESLSRPLGPPHDFAMLDVTHDHAVKAWADRVLSRLGPVDLLINNAALINVNAPLWKVSQTDFDHLIDVNIKGVANVIRHFLPAMLARGSGVVVNFSSGWGRSTAAEVAPYCATKWAIEGLSKALAQELPEGMASVPFNPGIIDTDMLRSTFGGQSSSFPKPEVWAKTAVPFLLNLGPKDNGRSLSAPGA